MKISKQINVSHLKLPLLAIHLETVRVSSLSQLASHCFFSTESHVNHLSMSRSSYARGANTGSDARPITAARIKRDVMDYPNEMAPLFIGSPKLRRTIKHGSWLL